MSEAIIDGLPLDALAAWMRANGLDHAPPLRARRLAGGHSNLTYHVLDSVDRSWVVRRPPLSSRLATAHDVGREYRVMKALHDSAVPVPTMIALEPNETAIGAPFYVCEFVEGRALHSLDDARLHTDPDARRRIGEQLLRILASLHRMDPSSVGLGDLGKGEQYIERQLARWLRQWEKSRTRIHPGVQAVHRMLARNVPVNLDVRIVHGDFRLGNTLVDAKGGVVAVLDWELCTLGDPLVDLGWLLHYWEEAGEPSAAFVTAPSRAPGFSTKQELARTYAREAGVGLTCISYYVAFAAWRLACIREGALARYMGGAMGAEETVDLDAYRQSIDACLQRAEDLLERGSDLDRL